MRVEVSLTDKVWFWGGRATPATGPKIDPAQNKCMTPKIPMSHDLSKEKTLRDTIRLILVLVLRIHHWVRNLRLVCGVTVCLRFLRNHHEEVERRSAPTDRRHKGHQQDNAADAALFFYFSRR
jgi:hypothetical protein